MKITGRSIVIIIIIATALGVYGLWNTTTSVSRHMHLGPIKREIITLRAQIVRGQFSLVEFRKMNRSFVSKLAVLESEKGVDSGLMGLLNDSADALTIAARNWDEMIQSEIKRGNKSESVKAFRDIRNEALENFVMYSGKALRLMEKN